MNSYIVNSFKLEAEFLFSKRGVNWYDRPVNFLGGLIMVIKCRMKWFWAGLLLSGLFTLPCRGQADPGAAQAPDPKVSGSGRENHTGTGCHFDAGQ